MLQRRPVPIKHCGLAALCGQLPRGDQDPDQVPPASSSGDLPEATRSPEHPPASPPSSNLRALSTNKLTCYLQTIHPQVLDKQKSVIKQIARAFSPITRALQTDFCLDCFIAKSFKSLFLFEMRRRLNRNKTKIRERRPGWAAARLGPISAVLIGNPHKSAENRTPAASPSVLLLSQTKHSGR